VIPVVNSYTIVIPFVVVTLTLKIVGSPLRLSKQKQTTCTAPLSKLKGIGAPKHNEGRH
jgi:hypothetical protein